ncbi:MAG: nuclease A inhibitor family protein [Acidobacteria bacterium]|nr:nuclease A inhibitor family protein [Acidobacteriota bacterium]MCA1638522.1 nuclease A inhibitor family protein [Acidobacteriota bacterium]
MKVFKIGKIELDVYAVGLNAENRLMGIKTKAVET